MRVGRILALAIALPLSQIHAGPAQAGETNAYAGAIAGAVLGGAICSAIAFGYPDDPETQAYDRQGWYLNVGGANALPTFESDVNSDARRHSGLPVRFVPQDALGINGGAGYRCNRYIAAEVKAERIMGFDADTSLPGMGEVASFDLKPLTVTTNFKLYYPAGWFQPYLLAGVGMMWSVVDLTDTVGLGLPFQDGGKGIAIRTGGGLDLYATRHVVLNVGVDWVLPFGQTQDLDYVSLSWGVQYRF